MLRKLREGDRRPIRIPLHRQKLTFLQMVIASSNGSRFDAFGANVPFAKVTEWPSRAFATQPRSSQSARPACFGARGSASARSHCTTPLEHLEARAGRSGLSAIQKAFGLVHGNPKSASAASRFPPKGVGDVFSSPLTQKRPARGIWGGAPWGPRKTWNFDAKGLCANNG